MWQIIFTKQAQKDSRKIKESGLKTKTEKLLEVLTRDPFLSPPPFKKLLGDLDGAYSSRINIQHRLVYQILTDQKIIKVIRLWSHYE
jgi:toxin YoeB